MSNSSSYSSSSSSSPAPPRATASDSTPLDVSAILSSSAGGAGAASRDLHLDLAYLEVLDSHPFDPVAFSASPSDTVSRSAQQAAQHLLRALFSLRSERVHNGALVSLPAPELRMPRWRPLPQRKPETRWEKFARIKGIQKRKKGKFVYDEKRDEYRPRFGYKRARDDEDTWVVEDNRSEREALGDVEFDPFVAAKKAKKERVQKQRRAELRNKVEAAKQTGALASVVKKQAADALKKAQMSTASLGKFDKRVRNEKPMKGVLRRQFEPTMLDASVEKERNQKALLRVLNKEVTQEEGVKVDRERALRNASAAKRKRR